MSNVLFDWSARPLTSGAVSPLPAMSLRPTNVLADPVSWPSFGTMTPTPAVPAVGSVRAAKGDGPSPASTGKQFTDMTQKEFEKEARNRAIADDAVSMFPGTPEGKAISAGITAAGVLGAPAGAFNLGVRGINALSEPAFNNRASYFSNVNYENAVNATYGYGGGPGFGLTDAVGNRNGYSGWAGGLDDPLAGGPEGPSGGSHDVTTSAGAVTTDAGNVTTGGSTVTGSGGDPGANTGECYITTAALRHTGEADDGDTLSTLRWFRDRFVPVGMVREYYDTAPGIVARIDARDDAAEIYRRIHDRYIRPAVQAVRAGEYGRALAVYVALVVGLLHNVTNSPHGEMPANANGRGTKASAEKPDQQ